MSIMRKSSVSRIFGWDYRFEVPLFGIFYFTTTVKTLEKEPTFSGVKHNFRPFRFLNRFLFSKKKLKNKLQNKMVISLFFNFKMQYNNIKALALYFFITSIN